LEETAQSVKHDKKRRKKERKEALRLEDITPPSTDVTENSTPAPEEKVGQSYNQNAELEALPQRAIDEFLRQEVVQISDPASNSSNLRPILSFSQLPTELFSQFASIFKSFSKPSSIQSTTWPFLLAGRDVVGIAETGSGKTLAFGLPLIARLLSVKKKKSIRAVVIAPTRELALQVHTQISSLCKLTSDLKAACIYGGTNKDEQRASLKNANIIIATPGRLKDFISDTTISLSRVSYLVLDEADRMLDAGFSEDIKHILSTTPPSPKRQTAMFTATWPKSIRDLAAKFMTNPVKITNGHNQSSSDDPSATGGLRANPRIKQTVHVIDPATKQTRLLQLLNTRTRADETARILIFCLYKKEATRIEAFLRSRGFSVAGIHGDLAQTQRINNLASFSTGKTPLLVATDVAARGLDIPNVKLVINLTFPLTAEDYVHRIGRTGRAGKDGEAITFFTEHDKALAGGLVNVLKGAGQDVPEDLLKFGTTVKKKVHEVYGAFYREDGGAGEETKAKKITFDD
jgi:ATP-dependent RNA helicase DBP3